MRKVKIRVTGLVQGVGFRFFTMMIANELNIKGMAENHYDGSVYIEAGGAVEDIEKFIEELKKSPGPASKVDEVIVKEDDTLHLPKKFITR